MYVCMYVCMYERTVAVEYKVRVPENEFLRCSRTVTKFIVGVTRPNFDHDTLRVDTISTSGKQKVIECRSSTSVWLGSANA
jgi:hypothetical protein